jgi:hypothetical protein
MRVVRDQSCSQFNFLRGHAEHGSFGLIEALLGLLLVSFAVGVTIFVTNSFTGMIQGAVQGSTRAAAANVELDLAATAAYNPATLTAISGRSSVTLVDPPLPTMSPFPGASPVPSPSPTAAYVLTSPVYNATTSTLTGTITGNGASVPVSISQRTFGQVNCDPRLEGSTQSNGYTVTVISTPVPGCP